MLSTSGFKAVGVALGDVILAALKDGADYLGEKIIKSLDWTKAKEARENCREFFGTPEAEAPRCLRKRILVQQSRQSNSKNLKEGDRRAE